MDKKDDIFNTAHLFGGLNPRAVSFVWRLITNLPPESPFFEMVCKQKQREAMAAVAIQDIVDNRSEQLQKAGLVCGEGKVHRAFITACCEVLGEGFDMTTADSEAAMSCVIDRAHALMDEEAN